VRKKILKAGRFKYKELLSINESAYAEIREVFAHQVEEKQEHYTLKGIRRKKVQLEESANSSLFGVDRKLKFILLYLRENPGQSFYGYTQGMSQSKVSEWISFLLPVLESSLSALNYTANYSLEYEHSEDQSSHLIADVVEREVPKRSCEVAQRIEYSGKKSRHTIKHFALCSPNGYLHLLSPCFSGSVHDKKIWEAMEVKTAGQNLLMDLGFLGAEQDRIEVILPFKKSKGKGLSKVKKQLNQALGSLRVVIEHAFGSVKRLKIIRQKIYLKTFEKREQVMRIAVALHNLRIVQRNTLLKNS
jgi:hypothetical protein